MTINIGGRPISKVLAGYVTGVIVEGSAIITDAASKDWSMSREAWIALTIGTFGPPTAAYLRKLNDKDIAQIVNANPTIAKANLDLGTTVAKHQPPY